MSGYLDCDEDQSEFRPIRMRPSESEDSDHVDSLNPDVVDFGSPCDSGNVSPDAVKNWLKTLLTTPTVSFEHPTAPLLRGIASPPSQSSEVTAAAFLWRFYIGAIRLLPTSVVRLTCWLKLSRTSSALMAA